MNFNKLYILLGLLFILAGCQETIDLDAPDGEKRTVVEAWLDNLEREQKIRITETLPYFENQFSPAITGANVVVTSSSGKVMNFIDQGDGDYIFDASSEAIGDVGETFTLSIETADKSFSAISQMNRVPVIDSIVQEFRDDDPFGDGIFCNFFSRDPEGLGDTYWIKTYQDGQFLDQPLELNIAYDAGFSAGQEVDNLIFIPPVREAMNPIRDSIGLSPWHQGEIVRVEIHSTNTETFFFLESIRDQLLNSLNTIFAEPIVNTKGNIINNTDEKEVLGIFNVAAISVLEYEIN